MTSSNGPIVLADSVVVDGESAQEIGPEMPLSTSNGALGPIGPISKPGHPNGDDEEMLVPLPASPDDHSDAVEVSLPETQSSRACDPWAADTQTRL